MICLILSSIHKALIIVVKVIDKVESLFEAKILNQSSPVYSVFCKTALVTAKFIPQCWKDGRLPQDNAKKEGKSS